jgi:hypothetical protein
MQNAKDTFYLTLRSRLAALNPSRTIIVRGAIRPGTLVEENELPATSIPLDTFRLQWTALHVDSTSPLPLVSMECAIQYATDGSSGSAGMDRGRRLAQMDAELASALAAEPQAVAKMNYAAAGVGVAPTAMATTIFWADPVFGVAAAVGERLERTATVQVFAYQEAGEV